MLPTNSIILERFEVSVVVVAKGPVSVPVALFVLLGCGELLTDLAVSFGAMAGGRRSRTSRRLKLKLSALYTFALCSKGSGEDHSSRIGTTGFSRVVYVNEPDRHEEEGFRYQLNEVSTTKYSLVTFIPKSLFEQFRRVANFYFLVSGILALTPLAPYTAVSALLPLCVVIAATMAKEGIEDWRRKHQVLLFSFIFDSCRY